MMTPGLVIADSQVHIWAPSTPERPWRAGRTPHKDVPFGATELLEEMNAAGVSRAILIPPFWEAERNDVVLEAARQYPERFAVMGRLDTDAQDARERLAAWRDQPGMLGLRFSFHRPHVPPVLDETSIDWWLWGAAERAGVPITLLVPHSLVHIVGRIAERYPGLKLILCHLALPTDKYDDEAFAQFAHLLPIARRENVAVKASALPVYTRDTYPFREIHQYLRQIYDAFGPKRMLWGSDLSRLPTTCSYKQVISLFTDELPWLTSEDKTWIMGRALCEWVGWRTDIT